MRCCVCKEKTATVHLTQLVLDEMQKFDFCAECAQLNGVGNPVRFAPLDPEKLAGKPGGQRI
jgi:protein arginine kinase activator